MASFIAALAAGLLLTPPQSRIETSGYRRRATIHVFCSPRHSRGLRHHSSFFPSSAGLLLTPPQSRIETRAACEGLANRRLLLTPPQSRIETWRPTARLRPGLLLTPPQSRIETLRRFHRDWCAAVFCSPRHSRGLRLSLSGRVSPTWSSAHPATVAD